MATSYVQVYYHLVWATKQREPYITEAMEAHLYPFIHHKCAELEVHIHALGGIDNHCHLACSLPVTLSVAEFMNRIKGASSHFINGFPNQEFHLYWQAGYSVHTFAKRDMPRVVAYILNQKEHHRNGSLWASLEKTPDEGSLATRP